MHPFRQPSFLDDHPFRQPEAEPNTDLIEQDQTGMEMAAATRAEEKKLKVRRKAEQNLADEERAARRARAQALSGINYVGTYWLWKERIPLGEISLVAGRGGIGKSLLLTLLCAWITTGRMKGEFHGTPRDVIFVANEDSYEKTVVPRLIAAEADLDRIHRVQIESPEAVGGDHLVLPKDCEILGEVVREVNAVAVFLDPLSSNMGDRDRNSPEVRASYERLRVFAQDLGIAVVGNAHTRKGASQDLLEAIMGSSEIGNVARAAIGIARNPNTEDHSVIVSQCKNNYGPPNMDSFTYTIVEKTFHSPSGELIAAPYIAWGPKSDMHVNDVISEPTSMIAKSDIDECKEWLVNYLQMNPGAPRRVVMAEAAKEGHKEHTVKKASTRIPVKVDKIGYPATSVWSLPFAK